MSEDLSKPFDSKDLGSSFDTAIAKNLDNPEIPPEKKKLISDIFNLLKETSVGIAERIEVKPGDSEEAKQEKKIEGERIQMILVLKKLELTLGGGIRKHEDVTDT